MTAEVTSPPALDGARSVVVLRALPGLGDLLCAVPALRSLRAGLPDAHITLLGVPAAAWFVERFGHDVDELLVLPAFPGLPEVDDDPRQAVAFCALVQSRRFDLAVQLHGDGSVANTLATLLGAAVTAGLTLPNRWPLAAGYGVSYDGEAHEIDRLRSVPLALGCPDTGADLELPPLASDEEDAAALDGLLPTRPFACVHPGGSKVDRRWPATEFAAVVDHLHAAGCDVVLTGGSDEQILAASVAARCRRPPIDLAGRCSLGGLAHVLRRSVVVVTNDTGVSHLAAAVRAPSVVIFTATDPRRWAPLDHDRHRAVGQPGLPPCGRRCRQDGCLHLARSPVPVARAEVLAAVDRQLARWAQVRGHG